MDVWSRSGSRYRVRATILLIINILLFCGVGAFAYWLRTGLLFAPARDDYWTELGYTFYGVGQAEVSLGSLLVQPINIQNVPMQIPIVALLMAALISIPILVSILYRFWASLPFIAIVGILAVMPWLAVTLLISCILASLRPFRTRYRFMSALIGLVPAVIYLVFAWAGTAEVMRGQIDPVDQIKFIAPWILAVVCATIVFAVVLAIAKLVDYRPGAITPLLTVMFALPVAWFEQYVGRDELYYRLLERLDQAYFTDGDAGTELMRSAQRNWQRIPPPRPSWESVQELEQQKWLFERTDMSPWEAELTRHQLELVDRCNAFLRYFPGSVYAVNAIYIRSRAHDRRLDLREFRTSKWIRYYDDFPAAQSRIGWRIILENRPDSNLAAAARLRLAQLHARDGEIDRAIELLDDLIRKFAHASRTFAPSVKTHSALDVFAREKPDDSLKVSIDRILLQARRLHDLLTANKDPVYRYEPITGRQDKNGASILGLADLDARHEGYLHHLQNLKDRYPKSLIEDNIELEMAKTAAENRDQIAKLQNLIETCADRPCDALPEALLRLSVACMNAGNLEKGIQAAARLRAEFPDSVWTVQTVRMTQPSTLGHAPALSATGGTK